MDGQLSLANYLWGVGRKDEAEKYFRGAVEKAPSNQMANRAMAVFLQHANRAAEAEPYLEGGRRAGDGRRTRRSALRSPTITSRSIVPTTRSSSRAAEPGQGERSCRQDASRSRAVLEETDRPRRIAPSTRRLKKEPANVEALLTKARFLGVERKYGDALTFATKAVRSSPTTSKRHFTVGMLNEARDNRPAAIAAFNQVLRLNPRAVTTQLHLSRLHLAEGNADLALSMAQDAAQQRPDDPSAQLSLARGLIAKGQLAQAEPVVKRLMNQYANTPMVLTTAATLSGARSRLGGRRERCSSAHCSSTPATSKR